jgi:hypothetical protein
MADPYRACLFYAIYNKNGVGGVQFFTARCEDHPREKDEGKLFDAKRITREESWCTK